jgi:membrane protein implicated in regulation of membrane protease activity
VGPTVRWNASRRYGFIVADPGPADHVIAAPAPAQRLRRTSQTGHSEVYASGVDPWVIWLIVAVVLAVAEIGTLTFVLGMLAAGATLAAVAALLGVPVAGQVVVFAAADALLLGLALPVARRHRNGPPAIRTGTARLIGTRAMALTAITTADGGQVRIGGETWTARPYDDGLLIPAGEWVDVLAIDGATAVVHPTTGPGPGI